MVLCLILKEKNHKLSNHLLLKKKLGFLALEYSGHGKSTGNFINCNISQWTNDTKIAIKKIVKKK